MKRVLLTLAAVLLLVSPALCKMTTQTPNVSSLKIQYDAGAKLFRMDGAPFTGTSVIKDSAGNTVKEISIVNGKRNGYEIWYKEGKPIQETCYKDDIKEGKSFVYSLNDFTLYQEIIYKNGKKHGLYKEFNPAGKVVTECQYKDGKRDGAYQTYHDSGKSRIQGHYTTGKKSGKWTYYKKDGSVQREKQY
ncbi:MAG: hypothetical protein HUN04_16950 [Desulfobacter sp.]|nr:MAG: hypothetical protein HUN04_16950 [Desulfobacter sp.]